MRPDGRLLGAAPPALLQELACYALCARRPPDLALCTRRGELLELTARSVCAAAALDPPPGPGLGPAPAALAEFWTSRGRKFYLLCAPGRLHVFSCGGHLDLHSSFDNLDRYSIEDPHCRGTPLVKIWREGEDLPLILNEDFEDASGPGQKRKPTEVSEFESSLQAKLTEARYTVAINEKRHDELKRLRQEASHVIFQDMCPNAYDAAFKSSQKCIEALSAVNSTPWIKLCNGQVVVGVTVSNDTESSTFRDIKFILQSNTEASVTYNTHIYEPSSSPPFWQKKSSNHLNAKSKATVIAVTGIEEFTKDSRIQYDGVVVYKYEGNEKFLPLQGNILTCLEIMRGTFDVLSSNEYDNNEFLSILATTINIDLNILQVASTSEEDIPDLISLFMEHFKMDKVGNTDNVLIHRTSPYHTLNGVMVLFEGAERIDRDILHRTSVYLRSKSQLSSLLHLIYDGIPCRLLVTTPETIIKGKQSSRVISTKSSNIMQSSMDIDEVLTSPELPKNDKLKDFGKSLCIQMSMVLQHFDECIVSMATSKSSVNLIGNKIDIMSSGQDKYVEFVNKLNCEIRTGNTFLS